MANIGYMVSKMQEIRMIVRKVGRRRGSGMADDLRGGWLYSDMKRLDTLSMDSCIETSQWIASLKKKNAFDTNTICRTQIAKYRPTC